MPGIVNVVGLGPGNLEMMSVSSRQILEEADVIFGYSTYLRLISDIAPEIPRMASGMRSEVRRAREALQAASAGKNVTVVSSGDPGIYGMAGLIFEVREQLNFDVEIKVFPGISALNAAASLLGAPLMTDFAAISLSDQLVPLEDISRRLEMTSQTDLILCFYNPKGRQRVLPFKLACEILLKWRSPQTLVGIVRQAYRPGQQVKVILLKDLAETEVDMLTIIVVGNSQTVLLDGKMITRRGYHKKYEKFEDNSC